MHRQATRWTAILVLTTLLGCVPIQMTPNGGDGDGDSLPPNGDPPDATAPQVLLTVSNPTPQVNEEVRLTCSVVAGAGAGTTFDFQSADGRLFGGGNSGVATFLVAETDVGVAFTYTCTATNEHGTSDASAPRTIIPG